MLVKIRDVRPLFLPLKKVNFDDEVAEVESTLPSLTNSSSIEEIFSDLLIISALLLFFFLSTICSLLLSATNRVKPDFTKRELKGAHFPL